MKPAPPPELAAGTRPESHVRRQKVVDGGLAETDQSLVDAGAEDLEHVGEAGLAVRAQPP